MSIIARRLVLSRNLNGLKIITASLSSVSPKLNNFQSASKVLTLQSVKTINLNNHKSNYSTDEKKTADINERIKLLLKGNKVVLFIKGTAAQPRCGFSKAVCDIFNMHGVSYTTHNILEDEALRSGIKEFSSWPTIPQIFFEGEFVGGCDILLEMHRNGELVEELEKIGIKSKLVESAGKK